MFEIVVDGEVFDTQDNFPDAADMAAEAAEEFGTVVVLREPGADWEIEVTP